MFKKVLATAAAFALCASGAAFAFSASDVESIQAFTNGTFYGTGVVRVEVVVKSDAVYEGATLASFDLVDRGSYKPVYGHVHLDRLEKADDRTLVIHTKDDTYADPEMNPIVYTGDVPVKTRVRQTFGVYPSNGSYFREDNGGKLHYTIADTDKFTDDGAGETFVPNVEGSNGGAIGTWCRPHLELKLLVSENAAADAAYGKYDDAAYIPYTKNGEPIKLGSLWLETVDEQIVKGSGTRPNTTSGTGGKFMELSDAGFKIPTTANDPRITDGTGDDYVRGFIYVPANYNPANGVVYTIQGNGISLWKIKNASNIRNGFMYDEATWSWRTLKNCPIIVNIQDRSNYGPGQYKEGIYDYVVDDARVMRAVKDHYKITGPQVLQGNSRGTMASSVIVKALLGRGYALWGYGFSDEDGKDVTRYLKDNVDFDFSDLAIDTFIAQNVTIGTNPGGSSSYVDGDWTALASSGLRIWALDGEQDLINVHTMKTYRAELKKLGFSDEWINENARLTGISSNIFQHWGETDHSVTRIVGRYFADTPYLGAGDTDAKDVHVNDDGTLKYGESRKAGDTYQTQARGVTRESPDGQQHNYTKGHVYTVYGEGVHDWAVSGRRYTSALKADDIESIQATTDGTIYGTGVVKVEVKYKSGTNLSGVTARDFDLQDRGSLNPAFGSVPIKSATVSGSTVTLTIPNDLPTPLKKDLVYTNPQGTAQGTPAPGARTRNTFGIYCTGAWFRDVNGIIRVANPGNYANEAFGATIDANPNNSGYFARPSLELRLRHRGEAGDKFLNLADQKTGKAQTSEKWLATIDNMEGKALVNGHTDGKFVSFEDAGIKVESTGNTKDVTDGRGEDYVRGHVYIPENYDPSKGIVFTLSGGGVSFWRLPDGSNNFGSDFMYDDAIRAWTGRGAIVASIHDRSAVPGELHDYYDFVEDDVRVMKYFKETYDITGPMVLAGNSRGSGAATVIVKALLKRPYDPLVLANAQVTEAEFEKVLGPEYDDVRIDTLICQNATSAFRGFVSDDFKALAEDGLKIWIFDGEQDANNITNYTNIVTDPAVIERGAQWVKDNLRLTGLASELFYQWGETDHSVTRINGWYFTEQPYYGPNLSVDENGILTWDEKLSDGDTYRLEARGLASNNGKESYDYVVHKDEFHAWSLASAGDDPTDTPYERHSSGGCDAGLGGLAVLALAAFAIRSKR